jgi:hypothetical protein
MPLRAIRSCRESGSGRADREDRWVGEVFGEREGHGTRCGLPVNGLLDFDVSTDGDVVWHVVTASDESAFGPLWPGLWEGPWPEEESGLSPWDRFAINNQDGEPLALWRAFAWAMTSAPLRVALPRYDRDQVAQCLRAAREDVALVRWEYSIDYESHPFAAANKGFEPARSSIPIHPEPDAWERGHRDFAGLFDVPDLATLHTIDIGVSFDVASELSLFGVADASFAALQKRLSGLGQPSLSEVLGEDDTFAHLTVVRDRFIGHHSYLALAARRDQSAKVEHLVRVFSERWDAYCQDVGSLETHQEFADAMEWLLAEPLGTT